MHLKKLKLRFDAVRSITLIHDFILCMAVWRDCQDSSASVYWMWRSAGCLYKASLSKCLYCPDKVLCCTQIGTD